MKRVTCLALCMHAMMAYAICRYVPAQYPTIQSAIDAAADLDTVLVSEGIYNEDIDFLGKVITVSSIFHIDNDPIHIANTIISGTGTTSVVKFIGQETQDALLKGLTIRGGNHPSGGGLYIVSSSPTIRNCVIHSNTGQQAGGVLLFNSNSRLINLTICNNLGRGLRVIGYQHPEINSCIIYNNGAEMALTSSTTISYCDLEIATAGVGNISTDPLLLDPTDNNYALQANSPCVNSGSPYLPAEFDGTRADMGAICHPNNAQSVYADITASETDVVCTGQYSIDFGSSIITFNCEASGLTWDFGDGGTSPLANPSHSFAAGGNYDISLLVNTASQNYLFIEPSFITIYNDISNFVPAELHASESPYYIGMEQVLHHNLAIEPGVEIFFGSGVNFTVMGTTTALGTEEAPISFQVFPGEDIAGALCFASACTFSYCNFAHYTSLSLYSLDQVLNIDHCRFEHAFSEALKLQTQANLTNSVISNCTNTGLLVQQGARIENCTISYSNDELVYLEDNYDQNEVYAVEFIDCVLTKNNTSDFNLYIGQGHTVSLSGCTIADGSIGILVNGDSRVVVSDCEIIDSSQSGIYAGETAILAVSYCDINGTVCGVEMNNPALAEICNNFLHNNYTGIKLTGSYDNEVSIQGNLICDNSDNGIMLLNSSPLISYNTIVSNRQEVNIAGDGIFYMEESAPHIVSNLIHDHAFDIRAMYPDPAYIPSAYCNVLQYPLPNGIADGGANIIADPMFLPGSGYHLSPNSPAIDSADPNPVYYDLLQNDIWGGVRVYDGDNNGSAIIDRGCNEYCPTAVEDETAVPAAEFTLEVYPNPMQDELKLRCTAKDNTLPYTIAIYNIRGQKLGELSEHAIKGNKQLSWNGRDGEGRTLATGIYIIQVKGKGFAVTRKITLIR